MNRIARITLSISCLFICFLWLGCRSASESAKNRSARELANSGAYDEVLNRLGREKWKPGEDPEIIMTYCEALVETGRSLPREMVSPPVTQHVSKFIHGYYSLRQGRLRESLKIFSELSQDKEHHVWGDLGMLEFSLASASIANMKRPLESLEREAGRIPSFVRTFNLPLYKAWYSFFSGRYDEAQMILNDYKDSIDPVMLSELKVRMLLREDRFDEAENIIRKMPIDYQVTAEMESALIKLKYGNKKWFEFLSEKRKKCPQFQTIESNYADALVDLGRIDAATEVRKKLVQARPFDVTVQLAFAAHQLYHGNLKDAKDYLVRLDYPPEVSFYDTLMARMYSQQGLNAKAWEYLNLAKEMFPKSPYALAGIAAMAFEERDFDKEYEALNEKLEAEPNDIETLVMMMFVHCFRKEYGEIWQIEKRINQSKRYIEPGIREKIDLVRNKCGTKGENLRGNPKGQPLTFDIHRGTFLI